MNPERRALPNRFTQTGESIVKLICMYTSSCEQMPVKRQLTTSTTILMRASWPDLTSSAVVFPDIVSVETFGRICGTYAGSTVELM